MLFYVLQPLYQFILNKIILWFALLFCVYTSKINTNFTSFHFYYLKKKKNLQIWYQNTSKKKKEKLTKNLINQNTSKKKKEKLTKILINEQQGGFEHMSKVNAPRN